MKKIFLFLAIAFTFSACEKDDICDATTSTTPQLVIEFYEYSNPTVLKTVSNLEIFSTGFDTIPFSGVSKIEVPLKTTDDAVTFNFIQNGGDTNTTNDNKDIIQINYSRNTVFVSRACGYKTTYTLNNPNGIVLTDAPTPDTFWIQDVNVITTNIETENEVHVKLYY